MFSEFTMNSICVSHIYFEFTISCANLRWINYRFHDFTIKSLDISRIYCEFTFVLREFLYANLLYMNSLYISQIYYEFTFFFSIRSIRYFIEYENTMCFANILRNHYLFRDFIIKFIFFSRQLIINTVTVPPKLYILRLYTMNSLLVHYLFR